MTTGTKCTEDRLFAQNHAQNLGTLHLCVFVDCNREYFKPMVENFSQGYPNEEKRHEVTI